MKENSIEEDVKKVNKYLELVLEKDYCDCNELNVIVGKHCVGSKNVAYAINNILSDYKKVIKENEEWQKVYQEEKDKQFEMIREKQKLEEKWDKDTHKLQNDLDIANAKIIELKETNKKLYETALEVSRQTYTPGNYIPIKKVKDKIEELNNKPLKIKENNKRYYETDAYNKIIIQVLRELIE